MIDVCCMDRKLSPRLLWVIWWFFAGRNTILLYGNWFRYVRSEELMCEQGISSARRAICLPSLSLSAAWWKTISPLTAFDFSHNRIRRRNYFLVAVGSALLQNGCPTSFFSLVLFLPRNVLWPLFVNKILSVLILYSDTKNIIYIKFLCHQVKFT